MCINYLQNELKVEAGKATKKFTGCLRQARKDRRAQLQVPHIVNGASLVIS
jgi:hypothetical protein